MKEKRNRDFYMEYNDCIKALDDPDITEQEIRYNNVYATGAYRVYQILRKWVIKKHWKDTNGYPMKKKFYNKGLLACSISIRKLASATGFANNTVQLLVKQLDESGWLDIGSTKMSRGQKVYVLGYWEGNNKENYREHLYSHEILSNEERISFDGIYTKFDFPTFEQF